MAARASFVLANFFGLEPKLVLFSIPVLNDIPTVHILNGLPKVAVPNILRLLDNVHHLGRGNLNSNFINNR